MDISSFCLFWLMILALHPALCIFVRSLLAVTSWAMCLYMLYWGLKLGLLLIAGTASLNSSFPFEWIVAITDKNDVYHFNSQIPIVVILMAWLLWYLGLVCSFRRSNTAGMMFAVFLLFLATLCYPGIEALASAGSRLLWGLDLPTLPSLLTASSFEVPLTPSRVVEYTWEVARAPPPPPRTVTVTLPEITLT